MKTKKAVKKKAVKKKSAPKKVVKKATTKKAVAPKKATKPKEEKVEYMTDEMMQNIFVFQPALTSKFTSSGKAVMKSVRLSFK